jgi:hypothetical protein
MSRVTQGCQPVSADHEITACEGNVVTGLDGEPALDVLLATWPCRWTSRARRWPSVRTTLVGLSRPPPGDGAGMPPAGARGSSAPTWWCATSSGWTRRAAASRLPRVEAGMKLAFCQRNMEAARADLVRICAEIREELEPEEVPLEAASAGRAGSRVGAACRPAEWPARST